MARQQEKADMKYRIKELKWTHDKWRESSLFYIEREDGSDAGPSVMNPYHSIESAKTVVDRLINPPPPPIPPKIIIHDYP